MSGYDYLSNDERKQLRRTMRNLGFEQFHGMNAFTKNLGGTEMFYSYRSFIAKLDGNEMIVDWTKFDCSPTTSRQFSRWLREKTDLSIWDIKVMSQHCDMDYRDSGEFFTVPHSEIRVFFVK